MSHILLIFLGNKLANVGSRDVEVFRPLVGVCCALGVDFALAILTGVFCAVICIVVVGVDGTARPVYDV